VCQLRHRVHLVRRKRPVRVALIHSQIPFRFYKQQPWPQYEITAKEPIISKSIRSTDCQLSVALVTRLNAVLVTPGVTQSHRNRNDTNEPKSPSLFPGPWAYFE
jgi:hypothetical protein